MKRDWLITFLILSIPDVAIAWLVMTAGDGKTSTFWWALLVLYGIQFFSTLKSTLAASLLYRLYGKKRLTESATQFLVAQKFPPAQPGEEIDEFLQRVAQGDEYPINQRLLAASEAAKLYQLEDQAIFPVLRVRAAYNAALRKYRGG
ncbi:hypothetical protein LP417_18895 [Polaromonas sp. P1-6]|nr:hypothetical protein LP417_18895 [Polaromonas sp. P1-6]